MSGPWGGWLRFTEREVDARMLGLLRILCCAAVVLDLLRVAQVGLADDLYVLYEHGGINGHPDAEAWVVRELGPPGGLWAYGATLALLTLAGLGLFTRPALLLGVLAYAQVGHLFSPGDRGVDRILRTVLLILIFSGAHRRFALGLRLWPQARRERVAAWPADLVRWLMVMVYLSAGVSKLMDQPDWLGAPTLPVVYRIMTDPMAAHLDPVAWLSLRPLWIFMGWATIAVELSAPLLLFRRTARWWSLCALPMHLGIALGMDLGMFSYGLMGLHVLLLWPWLGPLMDRVPALRAASAGPAPAPGTGPTAAG